MAKCKHCGKSIRYRRSRKGVWYPVDGEARTRAIATRNYDKLINDKPREPGDDEWMDDSLASQA